MTQAQETKIKMFTNEVLKIYGKKEKKEVKSKEVKQLSYDEKVFLSIQVGSVGDEGTVKEILYRDTYQIFIGVRGGISYVSKNNKLRHADTVYEAVCKSRV